MTTFEICVLVIQGIATIAIPVILLYIGNRLTKALKEKDLAQGYVQVAVDVLKTNVPPGSEELREWAVEVLNKYSEIPLPDKARADLVRRGLLGEAVRSIKIRILDENDIPVGGGNATVFQDRPTGRVGVYSTVVYEFPVSLEVPEQGEGDYLVKVKHPDYEDFTTEPGPLESLDGLCITLSPKSHPPPG